MKAKFLVPFIVLFLFLAFTSISLSSDRIRTQGMATIHHGAIDIARDKAIENALRNAVEEKAGVMIKSYTEVENFELKLDQILSESKGFVNNYRVISEGRENNTYKVLIEAEISDGKLKERLDAIALILTRKSKPRVMVLIDGDIKNAPLAESTMIKSFMSQGFTVVNPRGTQGGLYKKEETKNITENKLALTKMAREFGAEVVIAAYIDLINRPFKMGEIEIVTSEVTISGKALNGDTGEIITAGTKSMKGEAKRSSEEAAKELAKYLSDRILEKWSSDLASFQTVKIIISGVNSYNDLTALKDLLMAKIKGAKRLLQRSYQEGVLELDLEVRGNTQGVADDLETVALDGKKLRIKEIMANKISAELK